MRRCVGTALAQVTQFDSQQPIGVSGSGHSGRGNGSDEQNMDVSGTARPIANSSMAVYGASKAALNRLSHGLAVELAGTGIRVNTVEPRAAVMSEGATALIGDTVRADQIESMEEMVEAIVALGECPADFTGHNCISLDLIDQMGLSVHALDGSPLSRVAN